MKTKKTAVRPKTEALPKIFVSLSIAVFCLTAGVSFFMALVMGLNDLVNKSIPDFKISSISTATVSGGCPFTIDNSQATFGGAWCNFKETSRSGGTDCGLKGKFFSSNKIYINNIVKEIEYCSNNGGFQCIAYIPEIFSKWLSNDSLSAIINNSDCASVRYEFRSKIGRAFATNAIDSAMFIKRFNNILSPTFHMFSSLTKKTLNLALESNSNSSSFLGGSSSGKVGMGIDKLVAGRAINKIMGIFWNSNSMLWNTDGLGTNGPSYHASWDAIVLLNRIYEGYGDALFNDSQIQNSVCSKLAQFKQKLDSAHGYAANNYGYDFTKFSDQDNQRDYCPRCSTGSDSRIDNGGEPLISSDSNSQIRYFSLSYRDFYFGYVVGNSEFNFQGLACNLKDVCPSLCNESCQKNCSKYAF